MVTYSITGTTNYLSFDYAIFRKETGQHYTLVDSRTAKGLPHQTLNVVEDGARSRIEGLANWNAGTTGVHISIYEVLNLRPFVRNMADV